jgi:hypothetical protein
MEVAIALIGACIAVGAAVVSGIAGRQIAGKIEGLSSTSAALTTELQRRDRFFDLANRAREHADHSVVFFHLLTEDKSWIVAAVEKTIEHTLLDALAYGHNAATDAHPDPGAEAQFRRQVDSVLELERGMAGGLLKTTEDVVQAGVAHAWGELEGTRETQIAGYWSRREEILRQQAEAKASSTELASQRERISNAAVGLQVLGLMVVLTKDLFEVSAK